MSTIAGIFDACPGSGLGFRESGYSILFQMCSPKHPSIPKRLFQ